mmetsp:Transcript_708/g.1253  ORF Transcript_708/g.1253 Transcript_708/m.1253 type:complete len:83 (-) Transcript_708:50-298(-)
MEQHTNESRVDERRSIARIRTRAGTKIGMMNDRTERTKNNPLFGNRQGRWGDRERLGVAPDGVFKEVGLEKELKADDNTVVA